MSGRGVVVAPGQGPAWSMSSDRSAVRKPLGEATGGSIMLFEEQQQAHRTLASMNEREVAELRQRHGWEIVGPTPF